MPVTPLVSVVITTKNEEVHIENCLRSVKEQTYSRIELIVVDNNSTDQTKEIAQRYTKHVYEKGPERSAQRNYGMIDIASGQYAMFLDADMILSPGLVEGCAHIMHKHDYAALHIPEIVLGTNYWSRVRRFERTFYDGTVVDGARFFIREKLIQVKGFDTSITGPEDWDLDKKIKQIGEIGFFHYRSPNHQKWKLYSFILNKGVNPENYGEVIYHNEAEFDFIKYLKKKGYYAQSFDAYIQKWGQDDPDIQKQFGLFYRFFFVFLEKGKWKSLLQNPHLTTGMYGLRFLVGLRFLFRKT